MPKTRKAVNPTARRKKKRGNVLSLQEFKERKAAMKRYDENIERTVDIVFYIASVREPRRSYLLDKLLEVIEQNRQARSG